MKPSIRKVFSVLTEFFRFLADWENEHPYIFSFTLSVLIISYFLFHIPSVQTADRNILRTDEMVIVNISQLHSPSRYFKRDISIEDGQVSHSETNVQQAVGLSEGAESVDISFFPDVVPPRPIGKLKKLYPKIAREMNIEAVVNLELFVSENGIIRNVNILNVKLSRPLPAGLSSRIEQQFSDDAARILLGAQFSPPVVNGRKIPIKMEMPLRFRLE